MSQSTNDTFPTAINIATVESIHQQLVPAMQQLRETLNEKAKAFSTIVKLGRTHLQDATPLSLGQEFSGYVSALDHGLKRVEKALDHCYEVATGGTAVGTGINSVEGFGMAVSKEIAVITGLPFRYSHTKSFYRINSRTNSRSAHGQFVTMVQCFFHTVQSMIQCRNISGKFLAKAQRCSILQMGTT
jgi:fumarate hydratase class II